MAEWMFDRHGHTCLILDDEKVRNRYGTVVAWISGSNIFSLEGHHIGWFDGGVIYESNNNALAFTANRTGYLPNIPGLSGTPGMPGFSGTPGRPGFSGAPGMPARNGWSSHNPLSYFST